MVPRVKLSNLTLELVNKSKKVRIRNPQVIRASSVDSIKVENDLMIDSILPYKPSETQINFNKS